jgi:lysophospholipase L1-like esterase
MSARSTIRRATIAVASALRTGWLIAGATLATFVVAEGCYRANQRTGGAAQPTRGDAVRDPRTEKTWYADYARDFDATREQRWRSYVYFGRKPSYSGRHINIDSHGRRVTPQPTAPVVADARVFFFGGSTMWGTWQRDAHTIPAEASRRLQALVGANARIEVTNFGENGYVMTQQILQLVLQLRAGNHPDVVVFYDGLNDTGSTLMWGSPGVPQNEAKRVAEFDMGRALDRTGYARGLGRDMRAVGIVASEAINQLELVQRVRSLKPPVQRSYIPVDSAARATVRTYAENVRLIESLAAAYGFTAIYVWQPNVHATEKVLSPYEQRIHRQIASDPFQRRLREVHLAIPALLDSAMSGMAPGRFVNATSLFRGDTTHLFVDWVGHTNEAANPPIVDTFWAALSAAVMSARVESRARVNVVTPKGN